MKIGQVVRFGYDSEDLRSIPTVREVQILSVKRQNRKVVLISGWDLTKMAFRSFKPSKMFGQKYRHLEKPGLRMASV